MSYGSSSRRRSSRVLKATSAMVCTSILSSPLISVLFFCHRMLRRHLELLVHSCTCKKQDCAESCRKMRELLAHVMSCPVRTQGGCRKCRRVWLLLQYHAKTCKAKDCPVPKCAQIRDALRLRQLQQLQMEDRRREAQNRTIGHRVRPEQEQDDEEEQGGGEATGGK